MKRPAVFLDRDGVINQNSPAYIKSWQEFEFLPGVLHSLRLLSHTAYRIVIVTNQSGIGRRLMTKEAVKEIHDRMLVAVVAAGGRIDAIYSCPHAPNEGCRCRKPKPGMLLRAIHELSVDVRRSWLIGDGWRDIGAASSVGVRSIFIEAARPLYRLRLRRCLTARNLSAATTIIRRIGLSSS